MSDELSLQINKGEEDKKREAWAGFGVKLYRSEISFQLRAQEIIKKLVNPIETKLIPETEKSLALVKSEYKALQEDRLLITRNFDKVISRLIAPEKFIHEAILKIEQELFHAKVKEKEEIEIEANKAKELKLVAEEVRSYVADMRASILESHLNLINNAYAHALEKEIPVKDILSFLEKVKARINAESCTTPIPKITANYNDQATIDLEIIAQFKPVSAKEYIEGFNADLANKFFDWELALKNKPQAEKLNKEEFETTKAAIKEEKTKETTAAHLESLAVPISQTTTGKQLKEEYKLQSPSTIEEAFIIFNAAVVNRNEVIEQLRKITPINLSVKQLIAALEAIKNNDNNFSFTGLNFKLIEKL